MYLCKVSVTFELSNLQLKAQTHTHTNNMQITLTAASDMNLLASSHEQVGIVKTYLNVIGIPRMSSPVSDFTWLTIYSMTDDNTSTEFIRFPFTSLRSSGI